MPKIVSAGPDGERTALPQTPIGRLRGRGRRGEKREEEEGSGMEDEERDWEGRGGKGR